MGSLGSRKRKPQYHRSWESGVLAGYLGGQEAALALEVGSSAVCGAGTVLVPYSILRFVSGIALDPSSGF